MSTAGRIRSIGCALGVAGLLAGCGSTSLLPGRHTHRQASASTSSGGESGAPAASVDVIKGWSTALRTGHIAAAAGYFAVPSVFDNGAADEIQSLQEAELVNASLPCGAQFVSAFRDGPLVDALFRLTTRPGPGGGSNCGGAAGQPSRVAFLIEKGKIVHWLRAPDLPGDAKAVQGGRATSSTATSPSTTTQPTVPTVPSTATGTGTGPAI